MSYFHRMFGRQHPWVLHLHHLLLPLPPHRIFLHLQVPTSTMNRVLHVVVVAVTEVEVVLHVKKCSTQFIFNNPKCLNVRRGMLQIRSAVFFVRKLSSIVQALCNKTINGRSEIDLDVRKVLGTVRLVSLVKSMAGL